MKGLKIGIACDGCGGNLIARVSPDETYREMYTRSGYLLVSAPDGETFVAENMACLVLLAQRGRSAKHLEPGLASPLSPPYQMGRPVEPASGSGQGASLPGSTYHQRITQRATCMYCGTIFSGYDGSQALADLRAHEQAEHHV